MVTDETLRTGSDVGPKTYDVVIVGAGFAGLLAQYRLRELGLTTLTLEAGAGVGGTWYWNRYPGARCDAPSLEYSYSFSEDLEEEWTWTERYAAQPEIERYANFVADKFDLRRGIQFNSRVTSASWNPSTSRWLLETEHAEQIGAQFCVMALGGYSVPIEVNIPGLEDFEGEVYYTAKWPHRQVDFDGKRIGVIGTGSSGVQTITAIGEQSPEHLYVFQRTPNFSLAAKNRPRDPVEQADWKANREVYRERARNSGPGLAFPVLEGPQDDRSDEAFRKRMEIAWEHGAPGLFLMFPELSVDASVNEWVVQYLHSVVRSRVSDPALADLLCAKGHYFGARRPVVEDNYLETFMKPNVTLVDVKTSPIVEITPTGLRTESNEYSLDMLILATGFDSGSGGMLRIGIEGDAGVPLSEHWKSGPRTFIGMTIANFPNMFMTLGPGSPGLRSNGIVTAEAQTEWIVDLIHYMGENGFQSVVPSLQAEDEWTTHVAEVAARGLFTKDDTQFMGVNVPGKPRVYLAYLGGVGNFRRIAREVAEHRYQGFVFDGQEEPGRSDWLRPQSGTTPQVAVM